MLFQTSCFASTWVCGFAVAGFLVRGSRVADEGSCVLCVSFVSEDCLSRCMHRNRHAYIHVSRDLVDLLSINSA